MPDRLLAGMRLPVGARHERNIPRQGSSEQEQQRTKQQDTMQVSFCSCIRPAAAKNVRIDVAAQKQHLKKKQASGPDGGCTTKPGRMYLPSRSCTQKSKKALRKIVGPKGVLARPDCRFTATMVREIQRRGMSCSSKITIRVKLQDCQAVYCRASSIG